MRCQFVVAVDVVAENEEAAAKFVGGLSGHNLIVPSGVDVSRYLFYGPVQFDPSSTHAHIARGGKPIAAEDDPAWRSCSKNSAATQEKQEEKPKRGPGRPRKTQ